VGSGLAIGVRTQAPNRPAIKSRCHFRPGNDGAAFKPPPATPRKVLMRRRVRVEACSERACPKIVEGKAFGLDVKRGPLVWLLGGISGGRAAKETPEAKRSSGFSKLEFAD
jgi:hypothetical protein